MTDTLAPTPEFLARFKGRLEAPATDQRVNRPAYRKLGAREVLARRGDIGADQALAAAKLERHWLGAQGINVTDPDAPGGAGEPVEFARTYHSQKLVEARVAVGVAREWDALIAALCEETHTVEELGRRWKGYAKRENARTAGVCLICAGLERLATLWITPAGTRWDHPYKAEV
jgi:hypothetical protein